MSPILSRRNAARAPARLPRAPADPEIAVCAHSGLPTARVCHHLKMHSKSYGLPLVFVGDLDPADLMVFLALSRGGPRLEAPRERRIQVRYLGMEDRMLAICRKHLGKRRLVRACLQMTEREQQQMALVRRLVPRLESLIGPECWEILCSGRKIELEGAFQGALEKAAFARDLRDALSNTVA